MATKTYYELDSLASSSNFHALQDGGSAPSEVLFSPITGWQPSSSVAAGNYADLDSQSEVAAGTFSTTAKPTAVDNTIGNGFRIPTALTGSFASGSWVLGVRISSNSQVYNGTLRFRWRVFRSTSVTGASATELTSAAQVSGNVVNLQQFTLQTATVTWSAPVVTLSNEYLFFVLACEVVGGASLPNADCNLYKHSAASIATTDFTVATLTQDVGMVPIA